VKRFLSLILLMLSIALFAQSDIVAVVNGKNITMDEWNREANIQKLLIELKTSNDTFYQILTTTQEGLVVLEKYKLKILDIYIRKLLFIQFSESMKVAPKDDEVKADVDKKLRTCSPTLR